MSSDISEDKETFTTASNTVVLEATASSLNTDEEAKKIAAMVASWFVRRDNAFYDVAQLSNKLSSVDVKRIAVQRFREQLGDLKPKNDVLIQTFKIAIESIHDRPELSISTWNGVSSCRPDVESKLIRSNGTASVNTWSKPTYRNHEATALPLKFFLLLQQMIPPKEERELFLNWIAWNLQNEGDKPTWAPLLYSRRKGTGKSTLCWAVAQLFGQENTLTQNGIEKLTQRFNKPVLLRKLVICEEVELRQGSTQGNALKTLLTEKTTASEAKGRELESLEQCCCFLFTTNHFPSWIEAHERRYFVFDCDHDGHASGPGADTFNQLVADVREALKDPGRVSALYQWFLKKPLSNSFNAKSLNTVAVASPIMERLAAGSREVLLERLEELLAEKKVFGIGQSDLSTLVLDQLKMNANRLGHFMEELGWHRQRAKWGGVDFGRVLYVKPDCYVERGKIIASNGVKHSIFGLDDDIEIIDFAEEPVKQWPSKVANGDSYDEILF